MIQLYMPVLALPPRSGQNDLIFSSHIASLQLFQGVEFQLIFVVDVTKTS